jgi:hypothetical protein
VGLLAEADDFFYFDSQSNTMKKLIAGGCCILCLQTFSQAAPAKDISEETLQGRKGLIRAIAVIMNAESNKKVPARRICLPSCERPSF